MAKKKRKYQRRQQPEIHEGNGPVITYPQTRVEVMTSKEAVTFVVNFPHEPKVIG